MDTMNGDPVARGMKISGVVIGVVTDNNDNEGMGRVKVKFPWRDDNQDDSYW